MSRPKNTQRNASSRGRPRDAAGLAMDGAERERMDEAHRAESRPAVCRGRGTAETEAAAKQDGVGSLHYEVAMQPISVGRHPLAVMATKFSNSAIAPFGIAPLHSASRRKPPRLDSETARTPSAMS